MIPKIIHQIHLGNKKQSDKHLSWRKSWENFNPDWKFILWNEKIIKEKLQLHSPESFHCCKNFSEKSDILRFEILYQYGGIYIDTDFECLKPIDNLLVNKSFVIFRQNPNFICGAFMASEKHHPNLKKLIEGLNARTKTHGKSDSHNKFGPAYITEIIGINQSFDDGELSTQKTVYPFSWKNKMSKKFVLSNYPECYAIHYWEGSWK